MELHLDRSLAEQRLFPAIDIQKSGTRREELLLDKEELQTIWRFRQGIARSNSYEIMQSLLKQMRNTESNQKLLSGLRQVFK